MTFWIGAAALTLLAVAFILVPALRPGRGHAIASGAGQAALNAALYREQLEELQQQRDSDLLSDELWRERRTELEARLLEDVQEPAAATTTTTAARRPIALALVLALLLPMVAVALYHQLGSWRQWRLTQEYQAISQSLQQGQPDSDRMAALLADINAVAGRSDQPDWLFLQAQAYMQLGIYQAAADAFGRLRQVEPDNADLLGRQVQALYLARGRAIDDALQALMEEALALNPHQSTVLGIRGMHAFEGGDYAAAIAAWSQALAGLPPASDSAQMLQQGIRQARAALGGDAAEVAAAPSRPVAGPASGSGAATAGGFKDGIKVRVELAGQVDVRPGSVVYILAQAPTGGMPFAVVRMPVEGLPTEVVLDDSTAMAPGNALSSQSRVKITARVSASGNAIAAAGDWQGRSDVLTPDTVPALVAIRIDQQI